MISIPSKVFRSWLNWWLMRGIVKYSIAFLSGSENSMTRIRRFSENMSEIPRNVSFVMSKPKWGCLKQSAPKFDGLSSCSLRRRPGTTLRSTEWSSSENGSRLETPDGIDYYIHIIVCANFPQAFQRLFEFVLTNFTFTFQAQLVRGPCRFASLLSFHFFVRNGNVVNIAQTHPRGQCSAGSTWHVGRTCPGRMTILWYPMILLRLADLCSDKLGFQENILVCHTGCHTQ